MAIGKYKRIYMGAGATIISLFFILMAIGLQITSNGDQFCAGTIDDPCISDITIYNPTARNIYIYNEEQVKFDFSPNIKDYAFFTKDGRCGASGSCACTLKDGSSFGMKGWRCTDFTDETKPRKDRKYVFLWGRYTKREHRLVGFKENPDDKIKWTLGLPGDELDPVWDAPIKPIKKFEPVTYCENEPYIITKDSNGNKAMFPNFDGVCVTQLEQSNFTLNPDLTITALETTTLPLTDYRKTYSEVVGTKFDEKVGKEVNITETKYVTETKEYTKGEVYSLPELNTNGLIKIGSASDWFEITDFFYGDATNVSIDTNVTLTNLHTTQNESAMVGYWKFTDDATDSSSQGNDGTVTSATHVHERYEFDGDDDYINLTTTKEMLTTEDITITLWVKNKEPSLIQTYISNRLPAVGTNPGIQVQQTVGNYYLFFCDGSDTRISLIGGSVPDNQWTFIAAVFDRDGSMYLYENAGTPVSTAISAQQAGINSSVVWKIGNAGDLSAASYFNGTIDEVVVWNVSLSATDISNLYADGLYHTVDKGDAYIDGGILDLTNYNRIRDIAFTCVNDSYSNCSLSYRTGNYSSPLSNTEGLVSYWNLSDAESSTDFLGWNNINNGSCSGNNCPNRTNGLFENDAGMSFDGVNDEIKNSSEVGSEFYFDLRDVSISAWVKPNAVDSANHFIFTYGISPNYIDLRLDNGNKFQFNSQIGGSWKERAWGTTTPIKDNWYHVVGVFDRNGNNKIYVNGIDDTSGTAESTTANLSYIGYPFEIGGLYPSSGEFNGTIDSVAIYNRSLSSSEIQDLYTEWGGWSTKTTQSPIRINHNNKTLQYRVNLESSNTTSNPYLTNVTLWYNNSKPTISPIYIYSDDDTKNQTHVNLTGVFSASDLDSDSLSINQTTWYNNSIEEINLRNFTSILSGNTTKDDDWMFSARTWDGYQWSTWTNSTNFTILNTKPIIDLIYITSNDDAINSTYYNLTGTFSVTDVNSDSMVLNETKWYNNSIYESKLDNFTLVISGNTSEGDNWMFSGRTYDGEDWSNWYNSSNFTINNIPTVDVIYIITDDMTTNSTRVNLTGTFSATSGDNDNLVANETTWYNNSIEMTSLRNHTIVMYGNTSVENKWTFSGRTSDGKEWSPWVNSSILDIEWDPTYAIAYPTGVSFFEVNASEHTNYSLVPIGQNSTQGIFQVTCGGGDARGFDLYTRTNETLNSCMWIVVDSDNNQTGGFNLTTSYQEILTNLGITSGVTNIWAWVNFHNCSEGVYYPGFNFEGRAE